MNPFKTNWSKQSVVALREIVAVYSARGYNCSPAMRMRMKATATAARAELRRRLLSK